MFSSELDDDDNKDDDGDKDVGGDPDSGSVSGNDDDDEEGEDNSESEDPFEALDADARQELLDGTVAVCTTLDKVCSFPLCYHHHHLIHIFDRSENFPLLLYTPQQSCSLHGVKPVLPMVYLFISSLMM